MKLRNRVTLAELLQINEDIYGRQGYLVISCSQPLKLGTVLNRLDFEGDATKLFNANTQPFAVTGPSCVKNGSSA